MTLSTTDPEFRSAIHSCVTALRRLAKFEIDPTIDRRLRDLGERKEFLSKADHEELLALVEFARKRTIEKLEAEQAIRSLQRVLPGVVDID